MPSHKNDHLIGRKYGKLLIAEKLPQRSRFNHFLWRCECDCGNARTYNTSDLRKKLKLKDGPSCGCTYFHQDRQTALLSEMYSHLKYYHRKRSLRPAITFDPYCSLVRSPCFYCGSPPSNTHRTQGKCKSKLTYSGIDRIDSSLGYTDGNVRPCCRTCNVAKSSMSTAEFLTHVKRIYDHSIESAAYFEIA